MDLNELMQKMLEIFPDGEIGEDNQGQLVIYTGLKSVGDPTTTLVPFEA